MEMHDWTSYKDVPPPPSTRVEVSDGNVIVIAHWVADGPNCRVWSFDSGSKDFNIKWWRSLRQLPPQIDETPEETGASAV